MRATVERLRWWLAAATVLLLLLLAAMIGVGHWRAAKLWRDIQRRSGGHLERETDGFTWTQTMGGHTVATLHASKAIEHEHGQWTLHDVVVTTYGRVAGRADRLYGDEFEYNDTTGVARAIGEVQMDLQAPAALAAAHRAGPDMPESGMSGKGMAGMADTIHVRTRGVVFVRKLGVAATDQVVEIHYGRLTATSRGAEFDSGSSAVHLLADVHADGVLRGREAHLTAARADFDRTADQLVMQLPVLHTAELSGRANTATAQMRSDSTLETLNLAGSVTLEKGGPLGLQQVISPGLDVQFGAANQPREAKWTGGVQFRGKQEGSESEGTAAEARLLFDGSGLAQQLTAQGKVSGVEHSADGATMRSFQASALTALLKTEKGRSPEPRTVRLEGGAELGEQGKGENAPFTVLKGDKVVAQFLAVMGAKGARLQTVDATGSTVVDQKRADGSERLSAGDTLHAEFGPSAGGAARVELVKADQGGQVRLRSLPARAVGPAGGKTAAGPLTAEAERLHYVAAGTQAVLEGKVRVQQMGAQAGQLQADSVTVDTGSGDATAVGNVVGLLAGRPGAAEATHVAEATYVSAERGVFDHAANTAIFSAGSRPVRLWQGGSQVQAATVEVDAAAHVIAAKAASGGRVQAVFAAAAAAAGSAKTADGGPVQIQASSMRYAEASRVASFEGDVIVRNAEGQMRAQRGQALFSATQVSATQAANPPDRVQAATGLPAGKLERVELQGDVRVQQPGRTATGSKLVYSALEGTMLLTGSPGQPPVATMQGEGTVTGASLLFRPADKGVVVGSAAGQRARTVTEVPRKER